ncbi:50S ribosomal protein L39e [Candidatus Woesearchaeota archaeon]|nr:50S ribosomal protein L39e [Candidatus Woesearchaeota archaeon]
MARVIPPAKKKRLAKLGRQTRWAPFWTIPKIYGSNKKIHPGRHTEVKRSWRRGKTKV